jgi:hypothetical protein
MDAAHTTLLVVGLVLEIVSAVLIGSDLRRPTDESPEESDPSGSDVNSEAGSAERVKAGSEPPGEISYMSWIGVVLALAGFALLMLVALAITQG